MLVLTPVVCVTAAIAISRLLDTYLDPTLPVEEEAEPQTPKKTAKKANQPTFEFTGLLSGKKSNGIFGLDSRVAVVGTVLLLLTMFVHHCTYVTQSAYSSPSVVLASRNQDGSQNIIDDFREAYYWIRQNTEKDAVIMSWWDYGYQIAGMADRPTLVDNNTWNNSGFWMLNSTNPQLISPRSVKPCPVAKTLRTPFFAVMTWTMSSSSLAVCSGTLVTTLTSSCGWSVSHRASGPMRSMSQTTSLPGASTLSTSARRRLCATV